MPLFPAPVSYNPSKFRVYRATAQTISASSFVKVQFTTKEFDTGGNFDNATNYRFTASLPGFYHFDARVGTVASSVSILSLFKNGTEYSRGGDDRSIANAVTVSDTMQLAAGDYVEVYIFSSQTATEAGTAGELTHFSGYLVSTS